MNQPVRRTYSEKPRKGVRDVDSAHRARLVRMASLSSAGGVIGYLVATALVWPAESAWVRTLVPLGAAVAGFLLVFALSFLIVEGAGLVAGTIHNPTGSSTPRRSEHSRAEALAVQGHYREAVTAFGAAALEHPDDPTPWIRMARIHRDHLGEPEEAVRYFRVARDVAGVAEGQWRAITRELIEVFTGPLGQPVRAAPELARLAERAAGSPEGAWAARELREVKGMIAGEG